jgi:small-conductance mechanosensitive channel
MLVLKSLQKSAHGTLFLSLRRNLKAPILFIVPVAALSLATSFVDIEGTALDIAAKVLGICLIIGVAWLCIKVVSVVEEVILAQFSIDMEDNLRARKVRTQIQFFKRIVIVAIGVLTLAAILMSFKQVRQVGTTLLASAGVAGIIIGFAAQKSLATFIAGLQIAIAQPIRVDDVVIVEGQWGRIEEITLTYVVVRIWDLRRLVVPITYFVEKPFENWTRTSAHILGTVFFYLDYRTPIQPVREELHRRLKEHTLWDGETWSLQVTGLTDRTVELRALMSANNASEAWTLRCDVREGLLTFLQERYPESLPRIRAELFQQQAEG